MMVELVLEAAMAQKVDVSSMDVQEPTELWKKKNVSIYRRRLSMIEKLRTFFFP